MAKSRRHLRLEHSHRFAGSSAGQQSHSGVVRRPLGSRCHAGSALKKTTCGVCGKLSRSFYDRKRRRVRDLSCGNTRAFLDLEIRRVDCVRCGKVKQEKLDFLADNPFYTKRFGFYVGRRCRTSTIKDACSGVASGLAHGQGVREAVHAGAAPTSAGTPGPKVVGIDEISIRKRHTYRIVVSDLVRGRPIWFGGKDSSVASMDELFAWLRPRKSKGIRMAVMDMRKPFRTSTKAHAPEASILFDKFDVLRHLGVASAQLDARASMRD